MSTRETDEIQRTATNESLTERIWPVGVHIPVWLDNDCPSCGSAPCDPHPDTLACRECEDEWPCNIAANVADELDRMAEFIGGNPGDVLRWRASALRGVIPGLAPDTEDAGLTASERRTALLAAEGNSNTRIADLLHIQVSTVEQHLTKAYRKLGCQRAGLARALGGAE